MKLSLNAAIIAIIMAFKDNLQYLFCSLTSLFQNKNEFFPLEYNLVDLENLQVNNRLYFRQKHWKVTFITKKLSCLDMYFNWALSKFKKTTISSNALNHYLSSITIHFRTYI